MISTEVSKNKRSKPELYTVLATDAVLNVVNKIKCFLGFHNLQRFKHCDRHLVASYCKCCTVVKVGNPIYYDGTFYQRTLKKQKALEFIEKEIDYVQSVIDRRQSYKEWTTDEKIISEMIYKDEMDILLYYETIPNLNIIKDHIESTM